MDWDAVITSEMRDDAGSIGRVQTRASTATAIGPACRLHMHNAVLAYTSTHMAIRRRDRSLDNIYPGYSCFRCEFHLKKPP